MSGRPRWAALAVGLLALALALAGVVDAQAMSRRRADKIALRILSPQREPTSTGIVVYGLPHALRRGTLVGAFRGPGTPDLKSRLHHKAWLFWEDESPGAFFGHFSRLLLVADAGGRRALVGLSFWPLINGRPPPFLRPDGAISRRYAVYNSTAARAAAHSAGGPLAWNGPVAIAASAARPALQVKPSDFAHDCMVTVGYEKTSVSQGAPITAGPDFAALRAWASSVGLRTVDGGDTASSLGAAVDGTIATGCQDVFLFIAGHGTPPPGVWKAGPNRYRGGGGPASILTRYDVGAGGRLETASITPSDISSVLARHDKSRPVTDRATFKVKIMSCFSGRFELVLRGASNVEFYELSSAQDEASWGALKNGLDLVENGNPSHLDNPTDNPDGLSQFTNRDIHGLQMWSTSTAAHDNPDLANGLTRSFDLGASSDWTATLGFTHPIKGYSPGAVDVTFPPPPPTSNAFTVALANPGYDHTTPGNPSSTYPSTVCLNVTTNPKRPGASFNASISPGGPAASSRSTSGTLDANGQAFVVFGIPSYGSYTVSATVSANGATEASTTSIDAHAPPPSMTRSCAGGQPA